MSETIGLTWSDVDMKNREIHVGGQLVYYEGDEGYCFHDSETKTDAGIRDIPMTQMVYDAFRKQRELNLMLGLQSNVRDRWTQWIHLQYKAWTSNHAGGSEQLSEKYCQCL